MQKPFTQGPGKYLTFYEASVAPIQAFANGADPASFHPTTALCFDTVFSTRGDFCNSRDIWLRLKTLLIVKTGNLARVGR